jgi:hypothetical protein
MHDSPAQRAVTAATLSLVAGVACVVAFLPPVRAATLASVPQTVLLGVALATSLVLHWVSIGLAAHRMARSVPFWLGFSVLLFPIGSVATLVLLGWLLEEREPRLSVPAH